MDKKKRTAQQNAYAWGVLVKGYLDKAEEDTGILTDLIMEGLRRRGATEIDSKLMWELLKFAFNDGKTTTDLITTGFTNFVDEAREFMFFRYDKDIPPPNQVPIEGFE